MTTITIRRDDKKIEGVTMEDDFPSAVNLFVELATMLFEVHVNSILMEEDNDRDTSSGD